MSAKRTFLVVLVLVCFTLSGCIGSFSAFNRLLSWNKAVSDQKWVNEVIFLGLNVIPVYGIAWLGDILIFNAIEFWTGQNPMTEAQFSERGEWRAIQIFSGQDASRRMLLSLYRDGELVNTLDMSQSSPQEPLVGKVEWTDGRRESFSVRALGESVRVEHTDPRGTVITRLYEPAELAGIRQTVAGMRNAVMTAEAR